MIIAYSVLLMCTLYYTDHTIMSSVDIKPVMKL